MKLYLLQFSMQKTDSSSHIVCPVNLLLFIVTNHSFESTSFPQTMIEKSMWVTDDEFLVFACVKYGDIFHYYLSIHPSYQLISFAICAFSLFVRCYSEVPDAATLVETRPLHRDSALSIRERREKKF